jgi:HPt (histidine-containing phosphotransfer) domain-containing protein
MLRALESGPGPERLRHLLQRYRAEALSLSVDLAEQQAELEYWQRETAIRQIAGNGGTEALSRTCHELQAECDDLGLELAHVRLAIDGITDELQAHDQPAALDSVA